MLIATELQSETCRNPNRLVQQLV